MATYTTIQVIKMLRDVIPGMTLKGAKDLVDSFEIKAFEDRVANVLGEESRSALQNWARLFVRQEETEKARLYLETKAKEVNVPDWSQDVVDGCRCEECVRTLQSDENYCCSDCDGY